MVFEVTVLVEVMLSIKVSISRNTEVKLIVEVLWRVTVTVSLEVSWIPKSQIMNAFWLAVASEIRFALMIARKYVRI